MSIRTEGQNPYLQPLTEEQNPNFLVNRYDFSNGFCSKNSNSYWFQQFLLAKCSDLDLGKLKIDFFRSSSAIDFTVIKVPHSFKGAVTDILVNQVNQELGRKLYKISDSEYLIDNSFQLDYGYILVKFTDDARLSNFEKIVLNHHNTLDEIEDFSDEVFGIALALMFCRTYQFLNMSPPYTFSGFAKTYPFQGKFYKTFLGCIDNSFFVIFESLKNKTQDIYQIFHRGFQFIDEGPLTNTLRKLRDIGYLEKYMPELYSNNNIQQRPERNPDNVLEHLFKSASASLVVLKEFAAMNQIDPNAQAILSVALGALFHDAGKSETLVMK